MSKQKIDVAVFIGRFQPFHKGHAHVVEEALKTSDKMLIILGSHKKSSDIRNPLSSREREEIIRKSLPKEYLSRIEFAVQEDHLYNPDRWIASIQSLANNAYYKNGWKDRHPRIGIIGYDKDHTSYYLKQFPQFKLLDFSPTNINLNATNVRNAVYNSHVTPKELEKIMTDHFCNEEAANYFISCIKNKQHLFDEYEVIHKYKTDNDRGKYPVIYQTVDAVVVQSGHILLIQRKAAPGKDQWAFPGGFIKVNETLEDAVLRELKEETKIDVPYPVLKGSLVSTKTFDNPERSVRGRTITAAFYFHLNGDFSLPKVKGCDDAKNAKWFTFDEFANMREQIFEDHYSIAENMIGI